MGRCEVVKDRGDILMEPRQLKAITLNCWGVPVVARDRTARMCAIGDWLAQSDHDFVFLQEMWLTKDIRTILNRALATYQYHHFFHSGVIGSGMCILSRHRIVAAAYHRCSVNGFAHEVHHGDWFGGKGVGFCQVLVDNIKVHLYTTHLHANYNKSRDVYLCHRIVQSFDCAQFVCMTSSDADVIIFAGDFNCSPDELPYQLITRCAGLRDAYYSDDSTAKDGEESTCERPGNSYTPGNPCQPGGERIDLVFVGTRGGLCTRRVLYRHPLPDRVPGHRYSYSDHEAVEVTVSIAATTDVDSSWKYRTRTSEDGVLLQSLAVCDKYMKSLHRDQMFYSILSILLMATLLASLWIPQTHGWWQNLLRILFTMVFSYTSFMATVWSRMERAGIREGIAEMKIALSAASAVAGDDDGKSASSDVQDEINRVCLPPGSAD